MNLVRHTARIAAGTLVAAALPLVGPAMAHADSSPIAYSLTVTPTATTVGETVTVTATITNISSSTIAMNFGIVHSDESIVHTTAFSPSGCRNLGKTAYCGSPTFTPGSSTTLKITYATVATGSDTIDAYFNATGLPTEKHLDATLVVS